MKFSVSKSPCQTQAATFLPAKACQAVQSAFVPFGSDSTVSTQEGERCFMKTSAAFSAASKYKDWDSSPFPPSTVSSFLGHVFAQNSLQFRCHWQLFPMSSLARFQTKQNFIAERYRLVYIHMGEKRENKRQVHGVLAPGDWLPNEDKSFWSTLSWYV